jgi:hypothetical protein
MIVKKNLIFQIIFFSFLLLLIAYRGTCFLTEGIFEINEFQFYLYAKENGFFKGLFFIYDGANYFKLWTNIANSFASLFSIEVAKIITTYFSIFAYYIIFFYIFYFNSYLFLSLAQKIFAILIILVSPTMTPEVWMGSAHTREYFGIFSFILLFCRIDNESDLKKKISYLLVLISFLSSVWSISIYPFYLIRYYFEKTKQNFILFLYASIGFLIQFLIVTYYYFFNSINTSRFQIELYKIFSLIYNVPVRSFFGSTIPKSLFIETQFYYLKNFKEIIIVIFFMVIIGMFFYILKKRDYITNIISLALISTSLFAIIGSLYSDFVGGRYTVVSGIIIIFLVFRLFIIEKTKLLKFCFGSLLFLSLSIGLFEFKYNSPLPQLLTCKYHLNFN